jgi:sugar phosphate isomerase/epimerase
LSWSAKILDRITYHAVYDNSAMAALQYARANGFAGMQLAVELPHLAPDRTGMDELRRIGQYRSQHRLRISLHAPDDQCSMFACSRVLPRAIHGYFEDLFLYANDLGSRLVVMHLGAAPTFRTDTDPPMYLPPTSAKLYLEALLANLLRLMELAAKNKMTLAVENSSFSPQVREMIEPLLGQGPLRLCWDLAKNYDKAGNLDMEMEQFFWRNRSHVAQVHLHDIRDGRGHCVIGSGCVDFLHFLPRLAEANVQEYCIEVRPREKALQSLENLGKLLLSVKGQ